MQVYDPPPLTPQLTTAAVLTSLPPKVMSEAQQTTQPSLAPSSTTPAPMISDTTDERTMDGLVKNTNPPAVDSRDALLFDPDELTNYDVLGPTQGLETLPADSQTQGKASSAQIPSVDVANAPREPGLVIDLEGLGKQTTQQASPGDSSWLNWKMWVLGITVLVILGIILLMSMSSNAGSVVTAPGGGGMDYSMMGGYGGGGGGGGMNYAGGLGMQQGGSGGLGGMGGYGGY